MHAFCSKFSKPNFGKQYTYMDLCFSNRSGGKSHTNIIRVRKRMTRIKNQLGLLGSFELSKCVESSCECENNIGTGHGINTRPTII